MQTYESALHACCTIAVSFLSMSQASAHICARVVRCHTHSWTRDGCAPANAHCALVHRARAPIRPRASDAGPGREDARHHLCKSALQQHSQYVAEHCQSANLHSSSITYPVLSYPSITYPHLMMVHATITRKRRCRFLYVGLARAPAMTRYPGWQLARPAAWSRAQSPSLRCPAHGSHLSFTPHHTQA